MTTQGTGRDGGSGDECRRASAGARDHGRACRRLPSRGCREKPEKKKKILAGSECSQMENANEENKTTTRQTRRDIPGQAQNKSRARTIGSARPRRVPYTKTGCRNMSNTGNACVSYATGQPPVERHGGDQSRARNTTASQEAGLWGHAVAQQRECTALQREHEIQPTGTRGRKVRWRKRNERELPGIGWQGARGPHESARATEFRWATSSSANHTMSNSEQHRRQRASTKRKQDSPSSAFLRGVVVRLWADLPTRNLPFLVMLTVLSRRTTGNGILF